MSHWKRSEFGTSRSILYGFGDYRRGGGETNNYDSHPTLELDPKTLTRRQKQIDYGKNTREYQNYVECVPKEKRGPGHPTTPVLTRKYSRRAWDGLIKQWRISLHGWTFPETPSPINFSTLQMGSFGSEDNNNSLFHDSLLLSMRPNENENFGALKDHYWAAMASSSTLSPSFIHYQAQHHNLSPSNQLLAQIQRSHAGDFSQGRVNNYQLFN